MKSRLNYLAPLAIVITMLVMLSGCETTKGVGRDIERLGEKAQDILDPQ